MSIGVGLCQGAGWEFPSLCSVPWGCQRRGWTLAGRSLSNCPHYVCFIRKLTQARLMPTPASPNGVYHLTSLSYPNPGTRAASISGTTRKLAPALLNFPPLNVHQDQLKTTQGVTQSVLPCCRAHLSGPFPFSLMISPHVCPLHLSFFS